MYDGIEGILDFGYARILGILRFEWVVFDVL
jgi:hypothetical protein